MTIFKRLTVPVGLCDICLRDKAAGRHRKLGFVACNRCMVYILDALLAAQRYTPLPMRAGRRLLEKRKP